MKATDLKPGDIIISYKQAGSDNTPAHALMYEGTGQKPICHVVNMSGLSGLIRAGLERYLDPDEKDEVSADLSVYRCIKPEELGAKAAEYAGKWVDASSKDADWGQIKKDKQNSDYVHKFKTQYSDARRLRAEKEIKKKQEEEESKEKQEESQKKPLFEMTPRGIMKVVQAYASAADAGRVSPLHPKHGVYCDQFIHYCYQVASIDLAIGRNDLQIPESYLEKGGGIRHRDAFKLKKPTPLFDGGSDIFAIWNKFIEAAPSQIIEPLRFDPSKSYIVRLWEILYNDSKEEDPHFQRMQGIMGGRF